MKAQFIKKIKQTPPTPSETCRQVSSRNIYTIKGQINQYFKASTLRLCLNWTSYNLITPPGFNLECLVFKVFKATGKAFKALTAEKTGYWN